MRAPRAGRRKHQPWSTKPTSSSRPTVASVLEKLDALKASTDTSIANLQKQINASKGRHRQPAQGPAQVHRQRRRPRSTPPTKHRKHVALGAVTRNSRTACRPSSPRTAPLPPTPRRSPPSSCVSTSAIAAGYTDLDNRLAAVEERVADHGQRLDLIDPTIAAHTDEIAAHGQRIRALEENQASVKRLGRDQAELGLDASPVESLLRSAAWVIAYNWADQSSGWSWFTAIVIGTPPPACSSPRSRRSRCDHGSCFRRPRRHITASAPSAGSHACFEWGFGLQLTTPVSGGEVESREVPSRAHPGRRHGQVFNHLPCGGGGPKLRRCIMKSKFNFNTRWQLRLPFWCSSCWSSDHCR